MKASKISKTSDLNQVVISGEEKKTPNQPTTTKPTCAYLGVQCKMSRIVDKYYPLITQITKVHPSLKENSSLKHSPHTCALVWA